MDLIYNDGSKELSLQSLTTTAIIQKILEDEGMLPNCDRDVKTIASIAIKIVNNLPLSFLLKWQLRRMVLPIMEEMQSWYQKKYKKSRVVLTQNGTVDVPKSIRVILNNENVSLMQRFKVACDHCLEQEIFEIGAKINFPNNFGRHHPIWAYWLNWFDSADAILALYKVWYKIYEGNFHAKLGLKDISEDYCMKGFDEAFYRCNSAGVKYFVEGVSPIKIGERFHFKIQSISYAISFTPDACIKMFKRLHKDKRQQLKSCFSAILLKALLKWPYQHYFLKAAVLLAKDMDSEDFWPVAAMIVNKARHGWEDHDYKGLFIDFCLLGKESKICYNQPADCAREMLYDIILMRDERLAHFVLDNTTEKYLVQHLFNCGERSVFLLLIYEKHLEALELFMEVCKVNYDKLIIKFQEEITKFLDHGVS